MSITVLKSDGAINRYWFWVRLLDSGEEISRTAITRLPTTSPLVFVGIAAGAVIVVIVGIEYYSRQKRSKTHKSEVTTLIEACPLSTTVLRLS
jgi:ABC-type arginine/histidine transport system permease subunit